ncbi:cardiolipin synthase B, partial [Mesorhizobium sp. BR1-1-9]|nr:cardiolipin synthase B [Mesorhizobium sp. BR1-1-9]
MSLSDFVAFLAGAKPVRFGQKLDHLLPYLRYAAAALIASLITVLAINLAPEPRILRTLVPHRFDASDPEFVRSMS